MLLDARATIEISDLAEISQLVDDVLRTGAGIVLVRDDEPVAVLDPLPTKRRSSRSHARPADPLADPLMRVSGILDTGEPTDIARHKDDYIADAVDPRRR